MNSYEAIEGRIMVLSNDSNAGLSGQSPDWGGSQPASFTIYWRYPGGMSNMGWPIDEGFDATQIEEIMGSSELSNEQKREKINELVYRYGNRKLSGDWEEFRDYYINLTPPCLSIP